MLRKCSKFRTEFAQKYAILVQNLELLDTTLSKFFFFKKLTLNPIHIQTTPQQSRFHSNGSLGVQRVAKAGGRVSITRQDRGNGASWTP